MLLDLKLCLPTENLELISAATLAQLTRRLKLPQASEQTRVTIEFAQGQTDPLSYLYEQSGGERRALVVVSSRLIEHGEHGATASKAALRLLEASWRSSTVVGLIGVDASGVSHVTGLDAVVAEDRIEQRLAPCFRTLAQRLWFKLAPPRYASAAPLAEPDLHIRCVEDKHTFRECLRLRHRVYAALGYLEQKVTRASLKLDFDCYDPRASHFAVIDRNNADRVVATARLISPGNPLSMSGLFSTLFVKYEAWCNEFAEQESGAVYSRMLARRNSTALPIVDSFEHFNGMEEQQKYRPLTLPKNSCEISRVVVDPEYRGFGILRVLLDQARQSAKAKRKRYLLLECAPFHEQMYRKFGFEAIEDSGRSYYMRAQRLDAWAVAMHLDLSEQHRINGAPKVYKFTVKRHDGLPLDVAVSDSEIDAERIKASLAMPFARPEHASSVFADTAKQVDASLMSQLHVAFRRPDTDLIAALRELYRRMPAAKVRLLSGSAALALQNDDLFGQSDHALIARINNWLERLHVTV